jgi:thiol:disulfide interchange protein DsbD
VLLALGGIGRADDADPFSLTNKAEPKDPFALENQAKPQTQPEIIAPKSFGPTAEKLRKLIHFTAKVEPATARPGELVHLIVTGKPIRGFHTYPVTQRTPDQPVLQLSKLKLATPADLKPLWPITESSAEFTPSPFGVILEHDRGFTWSQDVLVLPEASPGPKDVRINIFLQVCDENGCTGPADYPPFSATVQVVAGTAGSLSDELRRRLSLAQPPVAIVPVPAAVGNSGNPKQPSVPPQTDKNAPAPSSGSSADLLGLLGAAFGGAFLMLLTPCVFPMIPITVNFFLKQSEKEHHRPLAVASVYSGTIIILLTLVMLALGKVVIDLANNAWFNLALGAVLIVFALSLFGMYEIELPSGLARFTSAREGQGGFLGAIFMALTFTITSFTCTGPFLGAMLAPVAGIQPPLLHLVLAAVVYSTTFAAPFFVLALFPSMMKKLPKSGGWLNAIKVTMGFLELGAALKFLANTDISWFPGNPRLFNYDTVLCSWIALSLACGLYLFGIFRLPHDDRVEHIGALRMVFGTIFLGLALYMLPALYGEKPRGVIGENLIAFLPPDLRENRPQRNGNGETELTWHLDYVDGWQQANRENKLIFIDFTGITCTNCRDNEQNVFPRRPVQEGLRRYALVRLYTDSVPNARLSRSEAEEQAARNSKWKDIIADPTNPTYIIFDPDRGEPLTKDGLLNGKVVAKRNGKIWDLDDFVGFLQNPRAPSQEASVSVSLRR